MIKKLLFIVCLIASTFTGAYAQTESSHLTFKGIPINGKSASFVAKLEQKGFIVTDRSNPDKIILHGKFTGQNVTLRVDATSATHTVCCVNVFFPEREQWDQLKNDYENIVSSYVSKYGEPFEKKEEFLPPFDQPSTTLQMLAIEEGKCQYYSSFKVENGGIGIEIDQFKGVCVAYVDKVNYALYEKEMQDEI
jgi:hypothetical protein